MKSNTPSTYNQSTAQLLFKSVAKSKSLAYVSRFTPAEFRDFEWMLTLTMQTKWSAENLSKPPSRYLIRDIIFYKVDSSSIVYADIPRLSAVGTKFKFWPRDSPPCFSTCSCEAGRSAARSVDQDELLIVAVIGCKWCPWESKCLFSEWRILTQVFAKSL